MAIWLLATFGISSAALAVDGGAGDGGGAHNQKIAGIRGTVCASCHFSVSDKGEKIWPDIPIGAQTLPQEKQESPLTGVQAVCSSCHYPGNAVNARSGFIMGRHEPHGHDFTHGNVLVDTSLLGTGESHVMSGQAQVDPEIGKLRTAMNNTVFPLRDADIQVQGKQGEVRGGSKDSGFTCTSCHDVHTQPNKDISGNGDYLRTKDKKMVGESNQRTAFCLQCHEDTPNDDKGTRGQGDKGTKVSSPGSRQHGVSAGCNQCHHPHDGYYQLKKEAQLGRSILTQRINPVNFQALPNVVAFGPAGENTVISDQLSVISKDSEKQVISSQLSVISKDSNSQPATSIRQPVSGNSEKLETDNFELETSFPDNLELKTSSEDVSALCYNCHGPSASQEMRDAGATPIYGSNGGSAPHKAHHPMGSQAELGRAPRAPGLKSAVLNACGQVTCTSCHDGFHRGKNLFFLRQDFSNDSSSLCTACHTDKTAKDLGIQGSAHNQICGKSQNKRGECMFCHFIHDGPDRGEQQQPATRALLRVDPVNLAWSDQAGDTNTSDYEDLCFGCHSSDEYMKGTGKEGARLQPEKYFSHRFSSVPSDLIQATFPVSDGDLNGVVDDYGVEKGKIYCGSCHDVHHSANAPYLRGKDSPYAGGGFCAHCHTENPANGKSSHSIDVSPRPGITEEEFPRFAYGGKSGVCRGITSDESATGQMTCLTCHSIHDAKTNFDGNIELAKKKVISDQLSEEKQVISEQLSVISKDSNQQPVSSIQQPASGNSEKLKTDNFELKTSLGRHGKLLVMDNFSSDEGSDLCRACHLPHQGVIGSRHDFADLNLGAPRSFGVCAACHVPHGSPEKAFLWTRSLAEERRVFRQDVRPNYQQGVTLLCYDCHDDHYSADDDPPLSSFLHAPQDIAFSDGPGKTTRVGYYETIPPGSMGEDGIKDPPSNGMETGGHYIKTAGLTGITNGINTGDKLSCDVCHDPHGKNRNEVFLRNPLGINTVDNLEASRNTRNGTGNGREICVSCHGYSEPDLPINTPIRLFEIDIVRTPPQEQIQLAVHSKSDSRTPCTQCHVHDRMAIPKSASTGPGTHEFHFQSLLSDGQQSIVARQLAATTDSSDKSCNICHSPELTYQGGKLLFKDGKILAETTVCDVCHSRGGYYDGVNGYSPVISIFDHGAKDSWAEGVYDEVTVEGKTDWQLRPGKDAWCLGCHDDQPSRIQNPDLDEKLWVQAPNVAGDAGRTWGFEVSGHGVAKTSIYQQSTQPGAGLICTNCHSPVAKHIVNSQREKKVNYKNWQANKFRLKLKLDLPRKNVEFKTSDFELCFSCHEPASVIGLPPGYWDYTNNYNPYVNLDTDTYPLTRYSNSNRVGIYPVKQMGQSLQIDFRKIFPTGSYNLHWNHLSLPNADIDSNAIIRPQTQSQNSTNSSNRRKQNCLSNRCHGKTNVIKEGDYSFWDSDRDGMLDSRPSCTACHNPHGSRYISMTRDDLAITHNSSKDGEYGMIGSKEYGAYDDSVDNYNDLFCWECHAKLQRLGSNYTFYPQPLIKDQTPPAPPR